MLKVVQESISRNAISMHVTTSAQVTKKYGGFFERQGFNPLEFHKDRYVLGDTECVWSATTDDLLQNASKSQRSYQNTEFYWASNVLPVSVTLIQLTEWKP